MKKLYTLFTSSLFLICLFITPLSAQTGAYVITATGDTLRGTVQQERSQQIVFEKNGQQGQTYTAKELMGYGNGQGEHFRSKRPVADEDQTAFFRIVVDGPVALYYNKGLRTEADYYFQKEQEPLTPLHRQYYAGTLSSLLSDCSSIAPQKVKYTNSSLREAIASYNQCRYGTQPSTSYSDDKNRIQVTAGVKAGIGFTTAATKGGVTALKSYTFQSEPGFTAGLFVNFQKQGKQLSLQPELWFLQRNTSSDKYFDRPNNGSYTGTVVLDATLVQLPLLAKYGFGQRALQPYLLAGPSVNFAVADNISYTELYDATQNSLNRDMAEIGAGIGFVGGAGIAIPAGKRQLLLELRYSQEHFSSNSIDQSFRYSTIQLSGGITF